MSAILTPCDCVLLVLHGSSKPLNASQVSYFFRQHPVGAKLSFRNIAARYLHDMVLQGLVIAGDQGFSLSDIAKEQLIHCITERLSDEELSRFNLE